MEKAVFGTGVEGFLKAKLREIGVLGDGYNVLNQEGEKVRHSFRKHPATQFSWCLSSFR